MYSVENLHERLFKEGQTVNRSWKVLEVIVIDTHQHIRLEMML